MDKEYKFEMMVDREDYLHLVDEKWFDVDAAFMKNKKDIIRQIDHIIEDETKGLAEAEAEGDSLTRALYAERIEMLNKLRTRTESDIFLPMPEYSGWAYEIYIGTDGIRLQLIHQCDLRIDDNDPEYMFPTMIDQEYTVIELKPKYLSVTEFAKSRGVEPVTVRQWIRRGKIRDAIKAGSEWRISTLALPMTGRRYESASYHWDEDLENIPEEYSYLSDYNNAFFVQDENDRKVFYLTLIGDEKENELVLNTQERERIEYFMISRPEFKVYDRGRSYM